MENGRYLRSKASEFGLDLSETQLSLFARYMELMINANRQFNLTAITAPFDVYVKHFADSLTLFGAGLPKNGTLCDIGSGAGLPGIPLGIVAPNLDITLIDSTNKRVVFLNETSKELGLGNVSALHVRAEEYPKLHGKRFDYVTARAVAKLSVLVKYAMPLLKDGGVFYAMKGNYSTYAEEVEEAKPMLKKYGAEIKNVQEFVLDGGVTHSIISIVRHVI
jgi:16S rRNA (guanine527-N7)-methyltransferase